MLEVVVRFARAVTILLGCLIVLCGPVQDASAEVRTDPPFLSPFLTAAELLRLRDTPRPATHRLLVRLTGNSGGDYWINNGMLDLAEDWALWSPVGGDRLLYDFKLARILELDYWKNSFRAHDFLTADAFAHSERLNREAINAGERAAGVSDVVEDCDTDTELGMEAIRDPTPVGEPVRIYTAGNGSILTAQCGVRRIGTIRLSQTPVPSPVMWAVIARQIQMHPRLVEKARGMGSVPAAIETDFLMFGVTKVHAQWSLSSISANSTPYPLDATYEDPFLTHLSSRLHPHIISLAREAVMGTYDGGPPDVASWRARVKKVAERNAAVAVMETTQMASMFPGFLERCGKRDADWICSFMAKSRDLWRTEPALAAFHTILFLDPHDEQREEKILKAMAKAQSSQLGQHPALLAAFGTSMRNANPSTLAEAERIGLKIEPIEQLQKAIEAYPYNPLYWLDLSDDFFFGDWNFETGMFLNDVAFSLPMPLARRGEEMKQRRKFLLDLPRKRPNFYP